MAFRAFVAIPVPPDPSLVVLLDELGRLRADLKPVDPGQLHFTLSFLGQVEDGSADSLSEALAAAVRGLDRFTVRLRHVGAFPNVRHARVVWVGVDDPRPLVALATRVREELAARSFPRDDKDFRAHLTLARVRPDSPQGDLTDFLRRHANDEPGDVAVDGAVLYRSVLSPQGPRYDALATAALEA